MQATLDAFSLKGLTKALTCLSKYGDELSIYATSEFLSFSATNSSKSAYCLFKYEKQFFSRYRLGYSQNTRGSQENSEEIQNVTGQLMTKLFLSILKHRTVEKSVEKCELSIVEGDQRGDYEDDDHDSLESKLIVRLHCKHGVIKTHRLLMLTPTTLMAPGVPDTTNESRLTVGPKALKDLLDHFPLSKSAKSDPQLVWTFGDGEVGLKSMESSIDSRGRGQLSTELSISAGEFDAYDIYETPTIIAFHLREFNATIAFADSMTLTLDMRFTDPASPLFIDIEGDSTECLFVISTSQVPGTTRAGQNGSQIANTKKREREQSSSLTPRTKKPMKVVQPAAPEILNSSTSRSASHASGSMPPPSVIPNRDFSQGQQSGRNVGSLSAVPTRAKQNEPLFLPSSQLSAADEEMFQTAGLGVELMSAEELTQMLEEEGEEDHYCPQSPPQEELRPDHNDLHIDGPDSFELDPGIPATQSSQVSSSKSFHPLFED